MRRNWNWNWNWIREERREEERRGIIISVFVRNESNKGGGIRGWDDMRVYESERIRGEERRGGHRERERERERKRIESESICILCEMWILGL